jgi:hypothetical protein
VVVGLAIEKGEPRIVVSTFLETCTDGDRLSREPYRVAAEMSRDYRGRASTEAAAAVAEGRRRQDQLAAKGLQDIVRQLEEATCRPIVAALVVNRAGWITDLLEYSLAWPQHVPVAEVIAVRDALRFALRECGIAVIELDEKSLPDLAARMLDMSSAEIDARLKALGATVRKRGGKSRSMPACRRGPPLWRGAVEAVGQPAHAHSRPFSVANSSFGEPS